MALTLTTLARNASVDGRTALVAGGKLKLREGSTVNAVIALASPAFVAAAAGAASANSLPLSGVTLVTPTVGIDNYQVTKSDDTLCWSSNSVGVGSGDLQIDNLQPSAGEIVQVTAWTHGQPA
jgi:hypothetical protein